MSNNLDIPTTVLDEWAASIEWLRAHPETLRGKRSLSVFVASVVEDADAEQKAAGEEAAGQVMIKKSESNERRRFEFSVNR